MRNPPRPAGTPPDRIRRYTRAAAVGTVTIPIRIAPDGTVRVDAALIDLILRGQGWTEILEEAPRD